MLFRSEGSRRDEGVLMRTRIFFPSNSPKTMRKEKQTTVAIIEVVTELFKFLYSFAPNSLETNTEEPILQPAAKARKIRVIS